MLTDSTAPEQKDATQPTTTLTENEIKLSAPRVIKRRVKMHNFKDGSGRVRARRHANGGGWVAETATVEDSVYVGPKCQVFNQAAVTGNVVLKGNVNISGFAEISGDVKMTNNVSVTESARISGPITVKGTVYIRGHASISGTSYIVGKTGLTVCGRAVIQSSTLRGNVLIRDQSTVCHSSVEGSAQIFNDALVQNSVVIGRVRVEDNARVDKSFLVLQHPFENIDSNIDWICIKNNATLTRNTNIYFPVEVADGATLVNVQLHCVPRGRRFVTTRERIGNSFVLAHTGFSPPYLQQRLSEMEYARNNGSPSGIPNPAPIPPPPILNNGGVNFLALPTGRRRVLTPE